MKVVVFYRERNKRNLGNPAVITQPAVQNNNKAVQLTDANSSSPQTIGVEARDVPIAQVQERQRVNENHSAYYNNRFSIDQNSSTVKVNCDFNVELGSKGVVIKTDFVLDRKPDGVFYLRYNMANKSVDVINMLQLENYKRWGNIVDVYYIGTAYVVDGDVLIHLYRCMEDIKGAENVVILNNKNPKEVIFSYSRKAKELVDKINSKRKLFAGIDPLDSLSILEAQIDILTEIILASGIAKKSTLKRALEVAATNSVVRISKNDDLVRKMEEKAEIRELQKIYFQNK